MENISKISFAVMVSVFFGTNVLAMNIFEAMRVNNRDYVEQIIQDDRSQVEAREDGQTPLMLAAALGDEALVKLLLKEGAMVNAHRTGFCHRFSTALHFASLYGHQNVVDILLKNGANVNSKDDWFSDGRRPIDYALQFGHTSTVEKLLRNGAKYPKLVEGVFPVVFAKRKGYVDAAKVLMTYAKKQVKHNSLNY